MFTPGTNDGGEVDKHRVETSNEYNTPLKVDGALGTDHEEMHVDNVGRSTSTNNDHVLVAEDHAKYDEMGRMISFLETQVSMLEAPLDEIKMDARKWETNATNLKKMNDELEDQLQLLRGVTSTTKVRRSGDVRLESEVDELRTKLQNEMFEKIKLCAELRKEKVEIDRLHQSNTMLIAEIE